MNGNLQPFERGELPLPEFDAWKRDWPDFTDEQLRRAYDKLLSDEVWINDEYQVNIDYNPPHGFDGMDIIHLSIKRRDKEPIHDWRDLQAIKNMLVAPEAEAVELYPAESRLVDSANQFHLWVFVSRNKKFPQVPIGWSDRFTGTSDDAAKTGGKQRDR